MKKLLMPVLAFLSLCCSVHGQISSINPNTGVRGQSLSVSIIGSSTNFTSASSTSLRNGPTIIFPSTWQALSNTQIVATYNIPPNCTVGPYNVVVEGAFVTQTMAGGFYIGTGLPNGNYANVRGRVYKDANSNCISNTGEVGHVSQSVSFTPGPYYAMTDFNGNYSAWLPLGSYTAELLAPFPYSNTCPTNGQIPFNLTGNGQILAGQDLGTDNISYADAQIFAVGPRLRPGFTRAQFIHVSNQGNTFVTNAVIKFVKPSFASFGTTIPTATMINGDTAIWNASGMGSHTIFRANVYCPPNIPFGVLYSNHCSVTPSPMDLVTTNNTYEYEDTTTAALDPNDKRVFTANGDNADGDITVNDSLLTYIVRFQNTGNDTAYTVFVRDTLDIAHLDLGTLRILGASHTYNLAMSPDGKLEMYFANIMLPDSGANQAGSNGFFAYGVETRQGLPLGTIIPNSASIYFDFNAPVKTNTVNSRICDSLAAGFMSSLVGPTMQFTDQTAGTVSSWHWDFGDGNTSTLQHPSHNYAAPGTYQVCLVANGICRSDTTCSTVSVCLPPIAAMVVGTGGNGTYNFTDNSAHAISWLWDFGDGNTSTQQNPSHQYAVDGNYTVCLFVTSACGADTFCNTVPVCGVAVTAAFSSSSVGLSATFTNGSSNGQTWSWDFGDGNSSTAANPSHTYANVGTYQVCLMATSACGTIGTHCSTVSVCVAPTSSWNFTQPSAGTLDFTDGSQYATSWSWDFGNGASSGAQHPSHTYTVNGTYTICLIASNACGADTSCTTTTVCPAPLQAAFSSSANQYTYTFTDQSLGGMQYSWDFGDGNTSSLQNPVHTYATNGTYNVCQTVTNLCGTTHSTCHSFTVNVVGVEVAMPGFDITVMPNPVKDEAMVMVSNPGVSGHYAFELYDVRGAHVRHEQGQLNATLVIHRAGLAKGIYSFQIIQDGITLGVGRLMVE